MNNRTYLSLAFCISLNLVAAQAADVRQGLVSFWPLDTTDGVTTPDLSPFGNHLSLVNMDASHFVTGLRGKAASFNGTDQLLSRVYTIGEDNGLPISGATRYTVMLWVNGVGRTQQDRRVFSEGSDSSNNPLFNIGTDSAAAASSTNVVDIYIRNDANAVLVSHVKSKGMAFDGAWHHVAWVEENGSGRLYIDGQLDATVFNYQRSPRTLNTISLGGIQRAAAGAFFNGLIDEVAIFERPLTQGEILEVMTNSIATPVPAFAPLVVSPPQSFTNLLVGDSVTFTMQATGTRPLTYEWRKNDTLIAGANASTLALADLKLTDSGDYSVVVRNSLDTVTSAAARLVVNPIPSPNLTNDMVAYWPLNEVLGTKTPDLASGYDMELENLSAADVVDGKWGKAIRFDNARKTLLKRLNNPGEDLPIYQHAAFSVSLWVNGASFQTDRRVFSEGSTRTTQPLFNIGTHNGGADGTVDSYIRTDAGATSGDHRHSIGTAFDDTWHHIAYVQREVAGVMQATLYIDGVKDDVVLGPIRPLTLNTTTIGGILRASASAWFTGIIDDVAVWKRALSAEEVLQLVANVTPTPPSKLQPLAISSFKPDLPAVVQGSPIILRWDVSKDATVITIEPEVGDVTGKTTAGVGNTTVTMTNTTAFRLTVKRGLDTLSTTTTVAVVTGVAPNWTLLDDFDRYSPGPLAATGWWMDLRGEFAQVESVNGNRMMSIASTDSGAILRLQTLALKEGQQRTLFFRIVPRGAPTAALQHVLGLTDKNIRWYGDSTDNIGPVLYPTFDVDAWKLGVHNGVGAAVEFAPDPLLTNTVYAVWIYIKNQPMNDPISPYDIFSVYIQKEGDPNRLELFKDYLSDRDPLFVDPIIGGMGPDLDKLFVTGNNTAESALFDDFFISNTGFNATVPRPLSVGEPPVLGISKSGNQVEITWTAGTLESASTISGPWSTVPGATPPAYTVAPVDSQRYFRARR